MSTFNLNFTIKKYAIILLIYNVIILVWITHLHYFLFSILLNQKNIDFYGGLSLISQYIQYLFNIIFAVLVYRDFKAHDLKSPLTVIITLLFGFIGIALFFLQMIYHEYVNKLDNKSIV